jgi:hypothetical protein
MPRTDRGSDILTKEPIMPTITPFLWFDTPAEEAIHL